MHSKAGRKLFKDYEFLVDTLPMAIGRDRLVPRGISTQNLIVSAEGNTIQMRRDGKACFGMIRGGGAFSEDTHEVRLSDEQFTRLWSAGRSRRIERVKRTVGVGSNKAHTYAYAEPLNSICTFHIRLSSEKEAQIMGLAEELKWTPITGDVQYQVPNLVAMANVMAPNVDVKTAENGRVIAEMVERWERSHRVSTEEEDPVRIRTLIEENRRRMYTEMMNSISPVFPDSADETGGKDRVFASRGFGSAQEKYRIDAHDFREALKGVAVKVTDTRKQQDFYLSPESELRGGKGESLRVRRSWILSREEQDIEKGIIMAPGGVAGMVGEKKDFRATVSYRPSEQEREKKKLSYSFHVDNSAAELLWKLFFTQPVVVVKKREVYYTWNGLIIAVDADVTRNDKDSSPIHLSSFMEIKSPKSPDERAREKEFKRRVGLLRVDPITIDYNEMTSV